MKIVVSQKTDKYLSELKKLDVTDIIISDDHFSSAVNGLNDDELKEMTIKIHDNDLNCIVRVDRLYQESELESLKEYLKYLESISVDAILFSDIALSTIIKEAKLNLKAIYAPETLLTNSYDIEELKNDGIDNCVISKDIPFDNMLDIAHKVKDYCFLRVFGEILISYGRRRFISAYLRKLDEYRDNYFLQEETRTQLLPIVEKENGTWLYGYCLQSFNELEKISESGLTGIIIDEVFKDDDFTIEIVRLHHELLNKKISVEQALERLKQLDDREYCSLSEVKQTILEKE